MLLVRLFLYVINIPIMVIRSIVEFLVMELLILKGILKDADIPCDGIEDTIKALFRIVRFIDNNTFT